MQLVLRFEVQCQAVYSPYVQYGFADRSASGRFTNPQEDHEQNVENEKIAHGEPPQPQGGSAQYWFPRKRLLVRREAHEEGGRIKRQVNHGQRNVGREQAETSRRIQPGYGQVSLRDEVHGGRRLMKRCVKHQGTNHGQERLGDGLPHSLFQIQDQGQEGLQPKAMGKDNYLAHGHGHRGFEKKILEEKGLSHQSFNSQEDLSDRKLLDLSERRLSSHKHQGTNHGQENLGEDLPHALPQTQGQGPTDLQLKSMGKNNYLAIRLKHRDNHGPSDSEEGSLPHRSFNSQEDQEGSGERFSSRRVKRQWTNHAQGNIGEGQEDLRERIPLARSPKHSIDYEHRLDSDVLEHPEGAHGREGKGFDLRCGFGLRSLGQGSFEQKEDLVGLKDGAYSSRSGILAGDQGDTVAEGIIESGENTD